MLLRKDMTTFIKRDKFAEFERYEFNFITQLFIITKR